jgi:hypothetical protein
LVATVRRRGGPRHAGARRASFARPQAPSAPATSPRRSWAVGPNRPNQTQSDRCTRRSKCQFKQHIVLPRAETAAYCSVDCQRPMTSPCANRTDGIRPVAKPQVNQASAVPHESKSHTRPTMPLSRFRPTSRPTPRTATKSIKARYTGFGITATGANVGAKAPRRTLLESVVGGSVGANAPRLILPISPVGANVGAKAPRRTLPESVVGGSVGANAPRLILPISPVGANVGAKAPRRTLPESMTAAEQAELK